MDKIDVNIDVLKEVLNYFLGDDLAGDILQEISDAGLDNTNTVHEIITYLEEVGYECA